MPTCNKFLAFTLSAFVMLGSANAQSLTQYAPATTEMKVKKMSEHVYYVEGIPGVATDNQGFISNSRLYCDRRWGGYF